MSSTAPHTVHPRRSWSTAFLAGMASYLDAGAIITTGIALVLFAPALGISNGLLGVLSGLLTLCFAVGAIFGGRLGDRFGRRRVYSVTLIVFAVGALLLTFAVAPAMLVSGIVLVGFAIGADLPVSLALIAEQAPSGSKGRMVIFSAILWSVGIIVPIVLSIFVSPLGEFGARILYGQLVLVAIVIAIARRGLRESAEWEAKSSSLTLTTASSDEIRFTDLKQVFAPPVLFTAVATGLYYAIWNLGANSFGQFGTFFLVNLAGTSVQFASVLNLASFPLGIIASLIFMRVVDRPSRWGFFIAGTVCNVIAFATPLVFGFSVFSFVTLMALFGIGAGFCGESMYKVWSQELFPTLLRSSAQGITLAFARVIAGLVALVTPTLATGNPAALFGLLAACAVVSGVIGLFWIPRLKTAAQLEPTTIPQGSGDERPTVATS